jgi:hypothetical protein
LSATREPAVARAFQDALTVGGPNGIPKPMEFHILDPVRFINDILAWIHQICVSDREILQGIFELSSSNNCQLILRRHSKRNQKARRYFATRYSRQSTKYRCIAKCP